VADAPVQHLRNRPRQARSAARVELLLDVAEEVFEEVGYDAATTNLVAARADVPVGTLYRWFPDKAALAEALTDRYLDRLVELYAELLTDLEPGERIGDFLHRVMARLVAHTQDQRALPALLVSAMVPGGRSSAGARLREGLEGHIRALVEVRVPGVPDDIRDRTAEVCVTLAHLVLAAAADDDDPHREVMVAEYVDVMLAYLEAKFPVAGHPAWTDPNVPVKPVFAAPDRTARLAAATPPAT
jgi:AcrR family transcriptional regulator